MNNITNILSYALAGIASLCFVGGIAVLHGRKAGVNMDGLENMFI